MKTPSTPIARRLHIGGVAPAEGWEIFNVLPGSAVDHRGDAADLQRFPDETFAVIYASHVLEHLDYKGALQAGLREWYRVLEPRGELLLSVPDLATLARLFVEGSLTLDQRFMVMRMMFGGHVDEHDYHVVGLDFDILAYFHLDAGFADIERVEDLGVFDDTSRLVYAGVPISLNVVARKPARVTHC